MRCLAPLAPTLAPGVSVGATSATSTASATLGMALLTPSVGASFGSTLAHQIGLAAQRLGGNPRRLVLIEPPPPGPFPRGMRYLGQGRKVTLHDAAEACLLIRATAEAAAQRPERGADAEADQPPPTNKTTEELLAELRDLPDAALGYFITKAFPTMGRSEEEAVRTTSRTLHVVRHMQTLVFHEWMERKDPLPRFTGPDGDVYRPVLAAEAGECMST